MNYGWATVFTLAAWFAGLVIDVNVRVGDLGLRTVLPVIVMGCCIMKFIKDNNSPTLIVATLTSKTEKKAAQPTHCLVEPEKLEPSIVQAEQIFTIDKSRVQNFVGHLTPEEMSRVDDAVKISLALNPMGSIQKLKPIIRSAAAYAPPEVVDGKPPVYPYTPIKSDFEDAETVEEMMLYTELQSAVHAMIQRLEYSFTFNPSLLTSPKRKKQVAEILTEAEKYIWRMPAPN